MGFEPTTPGLKVRVNPSQTVPGAASGTHFVSERGPPGAVLTHAVAGSANELVSKMLANAERFNIYRDGAWGNETA